MEFLCISDKKLLTLYSTDWLGFTPETKRVYCAVRAECLNITQVHVSI